MEKGEMMTRMRTDAVRKQSEAQTVPLDRIWSHIVVLGITGGVGAGKSTILTALHEQYGALIIECDEVGRALQQKGAACYEPMRQLFGDGILFPDGTIDRKAVAHLIYTDAQKRDMLSCIVHPAVKAEVRRQLEAFDRQVGGLDGDQDAVGGDERIDGRDAQGRYAVNENVGILIPQMIDILLQDHFPAHGVAEQNLQSGQFDVGGQ